MTRFESSNVAGAEYVDGRIRIQFADGTIYDQGCAPDVFQRLLDAPSKGRFVRENLTDLKRIGFDRAAMKREPVKALAINTANLDVTNMMDEDECCTSRLGRALNAGHAGDNWTCPKCGCVWSGRIESDASVRHWSPQPSIEVIRLR